LNAELIYDDVEIPNLTPQVGTSKAQIEDTEEREVLDMRQGSETMAQTPIGAGIGDADE